MASTVNKDGIGEVYDSLEKKVSSTVNTFLNKFSITEAQKAQVISNAVVALIQMSGTLVSDAPLKDAQVAQATVQVNSILKDIEVKNAQIAQATAQTNAIISDQAIKATQSTKDLLVKDAQIAQATAQTSAITNEQSIKTAQSEKDLLVKDAQIAQATAQTSAITNEQSIKTAQSEKDLLVKEEQKLLITAQKLTEEKKADLTVRQKDFYNDQCRIERSKHLSSMSMGSLQSGTTTPSDLWTVTLNAANSIVPS